MKTKGTTKSTQPPKQAATKGKRNLLLFVAVILFLGTLVVVWRNTDKDEQGDNTTTPSSSVPIRADQDVLVGRWVRTDSNGGYTVEIRSASADGKLEASYFNPNPINIGRAEWQKKENSIVVVIELRDVNYPGSTYTLNFSSINDQLLGTYFQAVEGVNYDVAFARIR